MGLLSTEDLNLPDAPETLVYRALEQVLRNDPVIPAITRTFVAWRGETNDLLEPSYAACPFLKLNPFPKESEWITEGQHYMPVVVRIQIAVRGSKYENIANYWHAIRRAIFPLDQEAKLAVQAILRGIDESLVTKPTINLNAYSITGDDAGVRLTLGEGSITFGLFVRT